ncbi:MAG: DUF5317 domain-containing protein [Bacillota bacterium]|jgi:hypothetical protein
MLYEAIFLALGVGLIARGKLSRLAKIQLKNIGLVFISLAIQLGIDVAAHYIDLIVIYRLFFQGLSYILLFIFLFLNRKVPGVVFLALGFLMNFIVIMFNGGAMPTIVTGIDPEYIKSIKSGEVITYTLISEKTKLRWFADILIQPWPKAKAFSIGDIFISIGIFWLVLRTMIVEEKLAKLTSVRGVKL